MDDWAWGLGVCFSIGPAVVSGAMALAASSRAKEALRRSEGLATQVKTLRDALGLLRLEVHGAVPIPATEPPAPVTLEDAFAVAKAKAEVVAPKPAPVAPPPRPPIRVEPPPKPVDPPPPPPPPKPAFEWERWLGVRGAAVLGGIVFALAGLYLFRYSMTQGWISPALRVVLATLAGLGALVVSQQVRAKYLVTANALSAGGIVVLYAAFWGAAARYQLVPNLAAFGLMVLVTAVASVLAVRQHNRLVAYLGMLGGFATPILLSTGHDRPIALFTYVLMLDLALLTVAWMRRWSSVAALALGGTVLVQAGWVALKMGPGESWVAFTVLGVFAALFAAFAARFREGSHDVAARVMQLAALVTPTLFLVYFAGNAALAVPLPATAGLLAALGVGAAIVHRRSEKGEPLLLQLHAASQLAVMGAAVAARSGAELAGWPVMLLPAGLVLVGHVAAAWPGREERRTPALDVVTWSSAGLWALTVLASLRTGAEPNHLPFLCALPVLAGSMLWRARQASQPAWATLVGVGLALSIGLDRGVAGALELHDAAWRLGPSLVFGAALALWARVDRRMQGADGAVLGFSLGAMVLLGLFRHAQPAAPELVLLVNAALAALGAASAVRLRAAWAVPVLAALVGLAVLLPAPVAEGYRMPWASLLALGAASGAVLFAFVLAAGRDFHAKRPAAWALASVWPLLGPGLWRAWTEVFGDATQGALPVLLALVTLGTALVVQRFRLAPGRHGVAWLLAAGFASLAVAVPLQLERQWVVVAWALMGVSFLPLATRFEVRALRWMGHTLLGLSVTLLLCVPWLIQLGERGSWPILNWLSYTYLVPAVCVALAAKWSKDTRAAALLWLSCAVVTFVWATLSVFDVFADGPKLLLTLERLPARDLTLSLVWVAYAGALLALGMWRGSKTVRWASLGFLLLSIGKVFLYDLGELKDLYRVGSLLGLALSLLVVSFAYQRFVFRRSEVA